ncbi:phage tail protein [Escherichia sp. 79.0191]|uniref:phage tail-collar fiber domain-containing protein n=1 Tax=Escherichia sp. 79.0191 TaxID=2730947 RepID=UPI00159407CA|nr:phage tail protein [Escherichia sp. 79.0191]MBB2226731.1 phage tail protein [Escherichia sp. 79.0191]
MSALLTKAFEKWVAECAASNLPARPDAIIFALMEREPTREDNTVPEEKITYAVNELTYGQLSPDNIVCSAVVPDDCAFSYDWICLIHQASGTLCGVIKTPVRQKVTGESLIRNFTIIYSGIAKAAQITVPPQSWQTDLYPELKSMLKIPNRLSEIAAEGEDAQQESRDNLGLKSAATMDVQTDIYNRTEGCVALPGAFGYGAYPTQRKDFDKYATSATFASWVQTTPPGRYLVIQYGGPYSKDIIEGVVFTGEVEIKMLETATHENQNRRDKFVIFNGVNQDVYCCEVRAGSTNIRWTCLSQNLTAIDGARWLYDIAGPWYDVPFRDVAVGGLTQAAYRAANTDEYTIKRCDSVSGSTLIPCAVIVSNDGAPRYVLDTGRHFSGSYVSLGNSTQATSDFIFGLFVRVA